MSQKFDSPLEPKSIVIPVKDDQNVLCQYFYQLGRTEEKADNLLKRQDEISAELDKVRNDLEEFKRLKNYAYGTVIAAVFVIFVLLILIYIFKSEVSSFLSDLLAAVAANKA